MSRLLTIRQKLNLTQEELAERSGISVRTIQRMEAGTSPQGYTLKALAKGLGVSENDLTDTEEPVMPEYRRWLKLINFSALPFMFLPPLNIIVPLFIMSVNKEFTPVTRKLVTIQIIWTLLAAVLVLTTMALHDWFGVRSRYMMLIPILWISVNIFIILRNAVEIAKNQTLRIGTKFSLL